MTPSSLVPAHTQRKDPWVWVTLQSRVLEGGGGTAPGSFSVGNIGEIAGPSVPVIYVDYLGTTKKVQKKENTPNSPCVSARYQYLIIKTGESFALSSL